MENVNTLLWACRGIFNRKSELGDIQWNFIVPAAPWLLMGGLENSKGPLSWLNIKNWNIPVRGIFQYNFIDQTYYVFNVGTQWLSESISFPKYLFLVDLHKATATP